MVWGWAGSISFLSIVMIHPWFVWRNRIRWDMTEVWMDRSLVFVRRTWGSWVLDLLG